MIVVSLIFYLLVMLAANSSSKDGTIELLGRRENALVTVTSFNIVFTIVLIIFNLKAYSQFRSQNICFLKDAEFGMIVKEQMCITKVFDTPAGINIYWLDSDSIKTFTPDPYRIFREGDIVTIYYLKFSKEYLAYEL